MSEYEKSTIELKSINKTKDNENKVYNLKLNIKLMEYKLYGKKWGII